MKFMNLNYCTAAATTVTASSSSPHFPVLNLKHPFRSKRWRSTAATSESVVYDLVTTEPIDSVVLYWPKEDGIRLSNTAVIKIQANATNVWTSPAVNVTLTIDNVYMMCSHYFGTDQNYRYWRVVIQDPGNPYGYVELGLTWLGKALALPNIKNGFTFGLADQSKLSRTDFGHVYADKYPQVATIGVNYDFLEYSELQILENAFRQNGGHDPVMFVLDPTESVFNKNHYTVYGLMKQSFEEQHLFYDLLTPNDLTIVELS